LVAPRKITVQPVASATPKSGAADAGIVGRTPEGREDMGNASGVRGRQKPANVIIVETDDTSWLRLGAAVRKMNPA